MPPRYPENASESTSHASVAPEKNVNPSPMNAELSAQPQNAACVAHIQR